MKLMILIACLLLAFVSTQDASLVLDSKFDIYEEHVESISDKTKAAKCIASSKQLVINYIKLAIDVASENSEGSITDIAKMIKNGFEMLHNCSVLFCFGPTYEKCERDHPQGCEKWGLVIYPKCREGYTNWECCVCATECPSGFRDDGLFCAKPAPYGRGAGYVVWQKDKCFKKHPQGCEKYLAMWYPKCKEGYHNAGCCICSPNCPSGWTDIGVSCTKPSSYGRGVGYPISFGLQCLDQQEKKITFAENCEQQRQILLELAESVQQKLDQTLANGDDYQSYFPDHNKDLLELLEQYSYQCLEVIQ